MALDDVLAGLGGALEGGLANYSWQKEYQLKERKLEEDAEIRRLQLDIKAMLETMKEGGRGERHVTPSGNTVLREAGATARNDDDNTTSLTIAGDRNNVTMRGQDINETLGLRRDDTTRRGQDFGFTLGEMRDETTRYGINTRDATTRRGQDFGFTLGTNAEAGRNVRAGDANDLRIKENEKDRAVQREGIRRRGYSGIDFITPKADATREMRDGTGRPTAEPIEQVDPPSDDPPQPGSPEAPADKLEQLGAQVDSLAAQVQRATNPATKAALKSQLAKAWEAYKKAGGQ